MISKELLSEVLDCNIYEILPESEIIGSPKVIQYRTKNSFIPFDYINIYELANKCKEWAHTYKLSVRSFNGYGGWFCTISSWDDSTFKSKEFNATTEPEAIFKACQWILENK